MIKKKIKILYEDKHLIAVDKPSGLLTVSTDKEKDKTMVKEVSAYVKKANPRNKVFIVHRLDKDTSGIVLFAKNEELKHTLQDNWEKYATRRVYTAAVGGRIAKKKDRLQNYLAEDKTLRVYITEDKRLGKLAITNYEVLKETNKEALLKIQIETGRKNQIRVQLANIGNPIIGDKKYGSTKNPFRRLMLHASCLEFYHPVIKKTIVVESRLPHQFNLMFPTDN